MVFSDTTTKLGLIQDCEQNLFGDYGAISGNADRLYDFAARINRAYDKVSALIMSADGKWQWDDTNYTDLPIGSTPLVSGQQDYTMDVEHLAILKVVILDAAGNKKELTPYTITDPMGTVEAENNVANGGIPTWYRKTGVTFMLYPFPNYSKNDGLIVYFQRRPSYFSYADTNKSPGIPAIFHRYLSLEASLDYAISKGLPQKKDLNDRLMEMKAEVQEWYSKRAKDEPKIIRGVFRSTR